MMHTPDKSRGETMAGSDDQSGPAANHPPEFYAHLEQKVADRTRELAALNAIASVVSQSLDLDQVLNDALDKTLQVMEIEAGGLYLLDEQAGVLRVAAQCGFSPQFIAGVDHLKIGEGFSGRVVQSGEPLVVRDVSIDPRLTREVVKREGLRSLAIVPLNSKGKVLGTLFAMAYSFREFSDQDVQLLSSIGNQIGMAVDSARLFQAEQRRAEQFRVVTEVGQRITSILDIDEVLVQVVRLVHKTFDYDHVSIALVEGDEAVYRVGAGYLWDDPRFDFRPRRLKVGAEGTTGWVASTGEPLLVPDVNQEPRYVHMGGSNTRSELTVPIKFKERIIGVLDAQSDRTNAFDESDLVMLQALANQTAVAIENARLFEVEQRRAEQFRVVSEMGRQMTSILDADELLTEIARSIRETFGYYLVGISLIEDDQLVVRAGVGPAFDDLGGPAPRAKVGEEGITGWVAATGQARMVPDVRQEPHYLPLSDEVKTRSELAVPLKTKTGVIGVLNVESDKLDGFDESDLAMLQSLAHQAAIAIENARLFDAEQRRAEQFRVIGEVGGRITSILTGDELLAEVVHLVKKYLGYYLVGIGLVEGDELVFKMGEGGVWQDPDFQPPRLKVGGKGITTWVAQSGQPLLVPDVSREPRYYGLPEADEIRSELAVPLKTKEEVIGVLHVQSDRLNAFDASDLAVLQSLAHQAAIAIDNARLFRAEQRRAEQFRVIGEVGRHVTSILAVDELLEQLAKLIQKAFAYYLVEIGLVEEGRVVYKTRSGPSLDDDFESFRLDVDEESITGWVAATGQPLLIPDVSQEPRYVRVTTTETRSELVVPMKVKDQVIGVLNVESDRLNAFDESDLAVLQSLANQAAIAIDNARLYGQAQQLAVMQERQRLARELHDAVTQTLFSASLIAEALPELWEIDRQEGEQLLKELRQLSRGALAEMRTLLLELRPAALIDANLADLLRQLGEAVTGRTGAPVRVSVQVDCAFPSDVHVALYRIAQEALNNVVKHANAQQIEVSLQCIAYSTLDGEEREQIELQVRDDGVGFDPAAVPPDRLGLGIIRERAQDIGAALKIESKPGHGTAIVVEWQFPLTSAQTGNK
jgi:GAF domain-containing protein